MLKLASADTRKLLQQPETGMGYQFVEASTHDGVAREGIVFNAELFFFAGESRSILETKHYQDLLRTAKQSLEFKELRVQSRGMSKTAHMVSKAGPANEAPIAKTSANEVFKRFSAFPNDNRLNSDRSWRPGTYATTEEDAKNVRTGKDAVERYALPNPDPASYVFTGRPHVGTDIQRGIVAEAFGRKGGGVEVLFPSGTQPNTVTGPEKIPDE